MRMKALWLAIALGVLLAGCGGGGGGSTGGVPIPVVGGGNNNNNNGNNLFGPTGALSGVVMDANGTPVMGASVQVSATSLTTSLQTTTGADGSFTLNGVPALSPVTILIDPPPASGLAATQIPNIVVLADTTTPLQFPVQLTTANTGGGGGQVFTFGHCSVTVEIFNDTNGFDTADEPVTLELVSCELEGHSPATFDSVDDNFAGDNGFATFNQVQTPDPRDTLPFHYTIRVHWRATYSNGGTQSFFVTRFLSIDGTEDGQDLTEFFDLSAFDVPAQ